MRWVVSTVIWGAAALLIGLAAAVLIALLRSGGFTDQLGTVLWIVGGLMLAGGLLTLTPNTAAERTRWRAKREAGVRGNERPGSRRALPAKATPLDITSGVVLGSLGVLAVAFFVSSAVETRNEAELAKPYKVVIDQPAAEAAQNAGLDLEQVVTRTANKVIALLPHHGQITINVRLDPQATVPGIGVGAAPGPGSGELSITLDEKSKIGLGRSIATWVPASLARILYLNSRAREGPGYGETLGDALVSEGLSDHFVAQAFPKTPPQPWDHRNMTARQEAGIWRRAKRDLIIPGSYDHAEWFETGSNSLPHWSGYTFAYRLVAPYLAAGRSASQAVKTDAEIVYKPYATTH